MAKVVAPPAPAAGPALYHMPYVAATLAPAARPEPYRMPPAEVGQVVLWRHGTDTSEPPAPGVVLRTGTLALTLSLHVDGVRDHVLKTGVRHRTDPFLATSPEHDSGVWEYTPRDLRINALLDAVPAED